MENRTSRGTRMSGARSFQVWTVWSRADVTMKTMPEPRLEGREAASPGSGGEADPGDGAPGAVWRACTQQARTRLRDGGMN